MKSGMMSESWNTRFARSLMCMRASADMSLHGLVSAGTHTVD
jgi:hypothetical protein